MHGMYTAWVSNLPMGKGHTCYWVLVCTLHVAK